MVGKNLCPIGKHQSASELVYELLEKQKSAETILDPHSFFVCILTL